MDGNWVFAAGVDGALRVAASLRGEKVAQVIQLGMAYAPEPPFQSGRRRVRLLVFWRKHSAVVKCSPHAAWKQPGAWPRV
jgi:cyclohexyl-isocyanide hydratase